MKLFGSTKKLIGKTKHGGSVSNLEVVKVVLAQCNLIDNQYQQISQVFYTFIPNKSYTYLLNVEPRNVVCLKTCSTESDKIIIKVMDENGRQFDIKDKVI